MPNVPEEIRAAGIRLKAGDDLPLLRSECARLARCLRERKARSIGLAPAADHVAVPAVAIELARALADRSRSPVGVVDAGGSWACAGPLAEGSPAGGRILATIWLLENLALLTPRARKASEVLDELRGVAAGEAAGFGHLVVDLTGLDRLGEQVAAFDLLDAVAIVARSGLTTARQIQRRIRDLPEGRSLGVLLTGL